MSKFSSTSSSASTSWNNTPASSSPSSPSSSHHHSINMTSLDREESFDESPSIAVSGQQRDRNRNRNRKEDAELRESLLDSDSTPPITLSPTPAAPLTAARSSKKSAAAATAEKDSESRHTPPTLTLARLLATAREERTLIVFATISLFLSAVFTMASPALVGVIIDAISLDVTNDPNSVSVSALTQGFQNAGLGSSPSQLLSSAVSILCAMIVLAAFFSFTRGYLFNLAGERVVARLRKRLFGHLLQQEIAFFDQTRTAELLNRLSTDTTTLRDAATINISMGLRWLAQVLIGIAYLFFVSWKLTLVMLSVVPIIAIAARYYGRKLKALSKQTQEALAKATEVAEETFGQIRTVRSFYREPWQQKLYDDKVDETYRLGARQALLFGIFVALLIFVASMAPVLVLWYGATLAMSGELSVGTLLSYTLYTISVGVAFGGLSGLFASIMSALGACDRVFQLLDRVPAIPITGGIHLTKDEFSGVVEFKNVTFRYPTRNDIEVLKGVNFTLKPGTVTALVGPSGSGKSTTTALMERFYDIDSGEILVDGVDIRKLDGSWLHRQMALISQEPTLFCTSIRSNLLYGVDSSAQFTDEQIYEACTLANATEFIQAFPDQLETVVGERGLRLSGGQKARVALSRALLMNPKLILADEATAALDAESEYKVQQALDRLIAKKQDNQQKRTVLVIAHRLSTVKNADRVLVLDSGRIVEEGTHRELIQLNGLYAKLVKRQLWMDDDENHEQKTERMLKQEEDDKKMNGNGRKL